MYSFKSVKIVDSGKSIILQRAGGSSVRYHSTWLRDNALDPKTRDINNGQRLISLSDIPINTYIASASLDKEGNNIFLTFLPERKKVSFSVNWLEAHAYDTKPNNIKGWVSPDLKTWRNDISTNIPKVDSRKPAKILISMLKNKSNFFFINWSVSLIYPRKHIKTTNKFKNV